jgi:hypothetical protein
MEHWAKTIAKNGGIAAVTIQEGVDRLRELEAELIYLRNENKLFKAAQKISEETDEQIILEVINLRTEVKELTARAEKAEDELVRLRTDLERFTGHGLLDCHAICDQRDAAVAERGRLRAEVEQLKERLRIESAASAHALHWAEKAEVDTTQLHSELNYAKASETLYHDELAAEREKVRVLREALESIVVSEHLDGCCPYGCDAPYLAKTALAATKENQCLNQMNSTKINDGGPAFPMTGEGCHNLLYSQPGMTLRDYFMAHAPNTPDFFPRKIMRKEVQVPAPENGKGWVKWGTTEWFEDDLAHLVRWRTTYADTMLAARKEDGK